MRNISLILILMIMVFIGCKPKSKSSQETKTDSSKNTTLNMPDIGDIKNNSSTSGSSNWSKAYRDKFIQDCVGKASEKVSASEAFSYCNCMTDKIEVKYPNEKEVEASLTSADIETMRVGCVSNSNQGNQSNNQSNNNSSSASWSSADQSEFMDNCTTAELKNSLGTSGAYNYCDCMLKKLMYEYPNSALVGNIPKSRMTELARECLGR